MEIKRGWHGLGEVGTSHREMALIMLLLGFLYIRWIFDSVALGAGTVVFTVLFCTVAVAYMAVNGMRQTKTSLLYLGIVGLSALNFVLVDSPFSALNLLFLQAAAVYWISVTANRRISGDLSGYILGDGFLQLALVPFGNFGREAAALCSSGGEASLPSEEQKARRRKRRTNILLALCGILLMAPILLIVIFLLVSADAAFEEFISRIDFQIRMPENVGVILFEFCLGIPVACYLFGLLYGNVTGRRTELLTKQGFDRFVGNVRIVPQVMACAALGALIAVYVLFFATQAGYLFSAFRGQLPVSMTYAAYARRGFFELCAVAGINLAVMAAAMLFTARQRTEAAPETQGAEPVPTDGVLAGGDKIPKALRAAAAVLCILTVLLIGTALSKMGMYIHYYGLTRLRFFTTAFMFLMLIGFIIIFVRQIREFCCGRYLAVLCIAGFLALSYSNADGLIAQYNIGRYEKGTLSELDVEMFGDLSAGGIKPVYDFYMRTDEPAMKRRICRSLGIAAAPLDEDFAGEWQSVDADALDWQLAGTALYRGDESFSNRFRGWNYQRWQAENLIVEMAKDQAGQ